MWRRALAAMSMSIIGVLGCSGNDTPHPAGNNLDGTLAMNVDPTPADRRARSLALDAAHETLRGIDLDPATVAGASRVRSCTDGTGSTTDQRYGEYSSGVELAAGTLTDEQVSSVPGVLGIEFLEDSVDPDGVRLVSFALAVDDVEVTVSLSRSDDGAATLTTVTPCVD